MKRLLIALLIVLLAGGGAWFWYERSHRSNGGTYRTEQIKRGNLLASISATGTLEPEDVVDIGSQVAGMIKEFGTGADGKLIDYGSPVKPNTVLARIDDSLYQAKVQQSRAQVRSAETKVDQAKAKLDSAKAKVDQAKANTQRSEADLQSARAKLTQATRDLERIRRLIPSSSAAASDVDAAQAAHDTNQAGVGVATAALAQARASETDAQAAVGDATAAVADAEAAVDLAKAALRQDEVNLSYCTITALVEGTIIDRRVTIGQTVQSSFNTPSLFLIAKDLKRMRVWASVNEADIGQVRVGQAVEFLVDTYPNEKFTGTVDRIRLNATNTQNVVTYIVEVVTDNSSGKLLPFLTANLRFEVARRDDVLLVPNAALRYTPAQIPAGTEAPPRAKENKAKGDKSKGKESGSAGAERRDHGTVWVVENDTPRPVEVRIGLSDGNVTEVLSGLTEGSAVVTGESRGGPADDSTNPFAPRAFGGKKQQ
jgi:HlyD family secretion protein